MPLLASMSRSSAGLFLSSSAANFWTPSASEPSSVSLDCKDAFFSAASIDAISSAFRPANLTALRSFARVFLSWLGVPVEFFHAILREDFSTNLKFSYREKNDASLGCKGRQ
jgi:hypothetical protein